MAGILDAFGAMLGFGYRPEGQAKRRENWDRLNTPGPDGTLPPLSKRMEAAAELDPSVWGMRDFQQDYQATVQRERQQAEDARQAGDREQIAAVKQGMEMYAPGMPGEGGAPITPEQSARFQATIAMNAPPGSALEQAGMQGRQTAVNAKTAEGVAQAGVTEEQRRAERDNAWRQQAATVANSRAVANDIAQFNRTQAAGAKPPSGYDVVGGKLAPLPGTKAHTDVLDRVNISNQGLSQVDSYMDLATSGTVGKFGGVEKAKADALRSAIATQVMLAANGKSDADYAIALNRVPDLSSMRQMSATDISALNVLRGELAGKVKENKQLFGHVPGFVDYRRQTRADLPDGFKPRNP